MVYPCFFHKENVRSMLLVKAYKGSMRCGVLLGLPLKNRRAVFASSLCELYLASSVSYYFYLHFLVLCVLFSPALFFLLFSFCPYSLSLHLYFFPFNYLYFCKASFAIVYRTWHGINSGRVTLVTPSFLLVSRSESVVQTLECQAWILSCLSVAVFGCPSLL